jgi:prepilin signal peptidase PulO-like enzyme (type II secretory pathway)
LSRITEISLSVIYILLSSHLMCFIIFYYPKKLINEHKIYCQNFVNGDNTDNIQMQIKSFILPSLREILIVLCINIATIITINSFTPTPNALYVYMYLVFAQISISLFFIDKNHNILPEELTVTLFILGIVSALNNWIPVTLASSVMGAFYPTIFILLISLLMGFIRNKKEIGIGDLYYISASGSWLGIEKMPLFIIIMLIVALGLCLFYRSQKIPLGMAITIASCTCLVLPMTFFTFFII